MKALVSERSNINGIWYKKITNVSTHTDVKIIQYISRNMHTVLALLCFVVVIHWLIFPYPSGLLHWHCGNLTIVTVPAKQPWWIWINSSCEFVMIDCITTTKQSTTKPCAYFLGYTVGRDGMGDWNLIIKGRNVQFMLFNCNEYLHLQQYFWTIMCLWIILLCFSSQDMAEIMKSMKMNTLSPLQFLSVCRFDIESSCNSNPISGQVCNIKTSDTIQLLLWTHTIKKYFSPHLVHSLERNTYFEAYTSSLL